tara:strand:+ start:695 stop:835 length:141 start_codon:yes stop_codon:yes gene_type:complete
MASEAQVEVVCPTSPTVMVLGQPVTEAVAADPILTVVIFKLKSLLL